MSVPTACTPSSPAGEGLGVAAQSSHPSTPGAAAEGCPFSAGLVRGRCCGEGRLGTLALTWSGPVAEVPGTHGLHQADDHGAHTVAHGAVGLLPAGAASGHHGQLVVLCGSAASVPGASLVPGSHVSGSPSPAASLCLHVFMALSPASESLQQTPGIRHCGPW